MPAVCEGCDRPLGALEALPMVRLSRLHQGPTPCRGPSAAAARAAAVHVHVAGSAAPMTPITIDYELLVILAQVAENTAHELPCSCSYGGHTAIEERCMGTCTHALAIRARDAAAGALLDADPAARVFIILTDGEPEKACIIPAARAAEAAAQLQAARSAQWAGGTQRIAHLVPDTLAEVLTFLAEN